MTLSWHLHESYIIQQNKAYNDHDATTVDLEVPHKSNSTHKPLIQNDRNAYFETHTYKYHLLTGT